MAPLNSPNPSRRSRAPKVAGAVSMLEQYESQAEGDREPTVYPRASRNIAYRLFLWKTKFIDDNHAH